MDIDPNKLSLAVGLSQGYQRYLQACLATVPAELPKVVSWYGPGGPDRLPPNTRLVRPQREADNYMAGYVLNVAIRVVQTPYVVLADADFVFPQFFFEVIDPAPDWVLRFYAARLTAQATQAVLRGTPWHRLFADYQGKDGRIFQIIYGSHNPCVYPTEVLRQVRGYDERMVGWGKEDDQLTLRTRHFGLQDVRLPLIVGVLNDADVCDYPTYRRGHASSRNLALLRSRRRAVNRHGWGDAPE